MILYAIRHKQTGKYMPLAKRNRGYSLWNPSTEKTIIIATGNIPRLLRTKLSAEKVISAWIRYQNGRRSRYETHAGEWDEEFLTKDDGRKIEDLEIVKVKLDGLD